MVTPIVTEICRHGSQESIMSRNKRFQDQADALTRKREKEARHRALMQDHQNRKNLAMAQAEWDEFVAQSRGTQRVMHSQTGPCG